MNCRQAIKEIHARLEDQPTSVNAAALEAHLAECHRCRIEADRLAEITKRLQESRIQFSAPPDLTDQIWNAIQLHSMPKESPVSRRNFGIEWIGWRYATVGMAAGLVGIFIGSFFHQPVKHDNQIAVHSVPMVKAIQKDKIIKRIVNPAAEIPAQGVKPARIAPKPAAYPKRLKRHHTFYYAKLNQPNISNHNIPAGVHILAKTVNPANNMAKHDTRIIQSPKASDYEQVAQSLFHAQEVELKANNQVQEELEKTAHLLGQAMNLIQKSKEHSSPIQSEG